MIRLLQLLALLVAFSLDVKLKAAQQEPEQCLSQREKSCTLFTMEPTTLKMHELDLYLSAGTILYRSQQKDWNFVAGTLRVAAKKSMKLRTKIGEVVLYPGIQWLQWRDEKLWVYAIQGHTRIDLKASSLGVNLVPEGFVNWFGLIDRQGQNIQGIPKTIDGDVISRLLPGFQRSGDRKLISQSIHRMIATASEFYRDVAQEMEASALERERQKEQKEFQRKQAEKKIRDLFRQKYFSPVEFPEDDPNLNN